MEYKHTEKQFMNAVGVDHELWIAYWDDLVSKFNLVGTRSQKIEIIEKSNGPIRFKLLAAYNLAECTERKGPAIVDVSRIFGRGGKSD